MFITTYLLIRREIGLTREKLAAQEQSIKAYGSIEKEAKSLADRLKAIGDVQKNQNHFSEVLKEIATLTPSDVSIDSGGLDSEKNNASIIACSNSYESAAGLRNLLAKSQRFARVDVLELTSTESTPGTSEESDCGVKYKIRLDIGLKTGSIK